MNLYEGAKTSVRVDSELIEQFEVRVEMHQGSVLSPFHFAVVTLSLYWQDVLSGLLCADDVEDVLSGLLCAVC